VVAFCARVEFVPYAKMPTALSASTISASMIRASASTTLPLWGRVGSVALDQTDEKNMSWLVSWLNAIMPGVGGVNCQELLMKIERLSSLPLHLPEHHNSACFGQRRRDQCDPRLRIAFGDWSYPFRSSTGFAKTASSQD